MFERGTNLGVRAGAILKDRFEGGIEMTNLGLVSGVAEVLEE